MAMCLISLNDFTRALETHQRARAFCEEHGMPKLVALADYNIAYLYYFRGQYGRAIEALKATREPCESVGDAYLAALCRMDLSEIYLELNLSEDAAEMAEEASRRFRAPGHRATRRRSRWPTSPSPTASRARCCAPWSCARRRARSSSRSRTRSGPRCSTSTRR